MQRKRHFALGRLKKGQMNKTEAAYAKDLSMLEAAGGILWHKFEGIKLRLADNTFLTVDFAVMNLQGQIELHDVKGSPAIVTDDAKVKMKVASDMYPFIFKYVFPNPKKDGGGWRTEEIK